jgi:cytochrome c oxidase subunit IV
MADTHAHADAAGHEVAHSEHGHPTWKTYVVIGAILTVITAIEVAIFYIPALAGIIVPALLILSTAKFLIVVLFYMHLKFDSPVFGRMFFAPLFLAMLVVLGLIILFKVLPKYAI